MTALHLAQERLDLEAELATLNGTRDVGTFEADFLKVAKRYSEHKGISYTAWREVGVTPEVLKRAGINRSG